MNTAIYVYTDGVWSDSRHSDQRRTWKRGSEPHFLTPLPVDPRGAQINSIKLELEHPSRSWALDVVLMQYVVIV